MSLSFSCTLRVLISFNLYRTIKRISSPHWVHLSPSVVTMHVSSSRISCTIISDIVTLVVSKWNWFVEMNGLSCSAPLTLPPINGTNNMLTSAKLPVPNARYKSYKGDDIKVFCDTLASFFLTFELFFCYSWYSVFQKDLESSHVAVLPLTTSA